MGAFFNLIDKLYKKKIDATGLGVFRITYSLVLFCEVKQLYFFKNLVFDKIPFVQPSEIDPTPGLIAWMTAILCITFGLFTRQAAIINYVFSLVFIATTRTYEYHMFYSYMGINFLLVFLDTSKAFSLDNLRRKLKFSSTKFFYTPPKKVSVLNYYLPILIGIAFVYFDSVFHKLSSDLWTKGLGLWLPASVPQVAFIDHTWLLNNKYLVIGLGYLTLLFEIVFLFLFPVRKLWPYIFTIGFGLHIGILVVFPIPWFALGVMSIYLLFVPNSLWRHIQRKLEFKKPRIILLYNKESPLSNRIKIVLTHFDCFKILEVKDTKSHFQAGDVSLYSPSSSEALDSIDSGIRKMSNKKENVRYIKEHHTGDLPKTASTLPTNYVSAHFSNLPNAVSYQANHIAEKSLLLLTNEGIMYQSFDALRYVFLRLPALAPIAVFFYTPLIDLLFRKSYDYLSKLNRMYSFTEEGSGYTPPTPVKDNDKFKLLSFFTVGDLKVFLLSGALIFFAVLQFCSTYQSPIIKKLITITGIDQSIVGKGMENISWSVSKFSKVYFGITPHPVFMDGHFDGYNHIVGLEYVNSAKTEWLPIIDEDGSPSEFLRGFNWVKWSFRVNAPEINNRDLIMGIRDFTAFWLHKTGRSTEQATFKILVKKVDSPKEWSPNFLEEQRKRPWVNAGTVRWDKNEFYSKVAEIEKM